MDITRKDLAATAVTAIAAVCLAATSQGWSVPLIGASHRWAAAAILLLGTVACALGSPGDIANRSAATSVLAGLGVVAFGLGVAAIVTASLAVLAVLVADMVLLWAAATTRHMWGHLRHPTAAT